MTISQAKLKGNLGAVADYFLEANEGLGDYYITEDGAAEPAPPRGLGFLAKRLGLTGAVIAEQLLRLLDGRHPLTGKRLIPYRKDRVAGVDQTASAPKSVSVVWAVGAPEERQAVERSQDAAVATMADYMRRHCPLVRDHGEPQLARDVLAVAVNHHTSRQTEQQSARGTAPDVQLHTHVLWLMAEREDERLCAIYRDGIWNDRYEWEAAYHCALATELARSGFPIRRMTGKGGRYFEIDGIPEKLAKRWSGRSREVNDRMETAAARIREQTGREPTVVELRREVARSRSRKVHGHKTDLRHYWRGIAEIEGVTPEGLALLRRRGGCPAEAEARAIVTEELLGPEGLTKEQPTFSGSELRVAALRRGAGLLDVGQVERLVLDLQRSGELRLTADDRWTTRRMWELEQRVLTWNAERRGGQTPVQPASSRQILGVTKRRTPASERLSVEQLEVLRQMLSEQRSTAVRGWAGTGKGTVAAVAGEVWRSQNRRIIAVAVAGKRAGEFAAELGEGTEHLTVAQFIARTGNGRLQLRDTDVIVLDEASVVSHEQWDELRGATGKTAKLVMLGDDAQLPAINAGGLWPLLSRGSAELTEVFRIRSEWERVATTQLRRGESAAALGAYAEHGRLRLSPTRAESMQRAVHDWARDGRTGLLITDATNAERDWLNTEAQRHRVLAGELGAGTVAVEREEGTLTVHAGERVIFTAAYWPGTGRRIENGTTGIVESVDPGRGTMTVQTSEARPRAITLSAAAAPVALHYAVHVYKSQGDTVDRAYVITGGRQASKESLYVACTRARDATRTYLDKETLGRDVDADAIAEAAARGSRSRAKVAASAHDEEHATGGATNDVAARSAVPQRRIHRGEKARRPWQDRRPLTERYRQRKARQSALRDARLERESEAVQRRHEHDLPRPTLESIATREGVPVWALEVEQLVTDRSYVAEHVARHSERSLIG